MLNKMLALILLIISSFSFTTAVYAIYDPLSVPNNRFGIHITNPDDTKMNNAQILVNSSGGDWGYVTLVMGDNNLDINHWQSIFNTLRRRHLIPIVRLATHPEGNWWARPTPGEEQTWANFLNELIWPTKNRYVLVYNEPNNALEWGNTVDAGSYAHVLDATITALKAKSADFFILNAGMDASAPNNPPAYEDMQLFMTQMNQAVPGIFNRLDGWASHSYPNPNFSGSPSDTGRATVRSWQWELSVLKNLGLTKKLPVFISETGWKHAEGNTYDSSLLPADTVAQYFQNAFSNAWNDPQIVAVTPFLIADMSSFDHFSFQRSTPAPSGSYPDFYPQYATILQMSKTAGKPIQENKADIANEGIYSILPVTETISIPVTLKNTGQSIWGEYSPVSLKVIKNDKSFTISNASLPQGTLIEPGQSYTFTISVTTYQLGSFGTTLQLFSGDKPFDSSPFQFKTEVKTPVDFQVKASLQWKKDQQGSYLFVAESPVGNALSQVVLDSDGISPTEHIATLLPGKTYNLTLYRPYYQPKVLTVTLKPGLNTLDFGILEPKLLSAVTDPITFWELLPFSQ